MDQLCGDDTELRRAVDRQLEAVERGEVLDPVYELSIGVLEASTEWIGRTVSHYQVTERLGRGGMGEVFLAKDTQLGRDVAIKVLPASVAADARRLARLEREAKVLAALNHPNIAQIYDFGQERGQRFLVMELAAGKTLESRIRQGPLPAGEAAEIARQIAAALATAHDRGIVHRDLKPANVNVCETAGGSAEVKVLDFGLAKGPIGRRSSPSEISHSPTVTAPTAMGTLLGTAAYMSPEQARGHQADSRSDIWALGCVLYEMLCARRAFCGGTTSEVLASVLRDEPDWERLPPTHPRLERILRRCLEKNPARRWHHAADVALELEASEALTATPRNAALPEGRRSFTPWAVPALLVLAAASGGLAGGYWLGNSRSPAMDDSSIEPTYTEMSAPLPGTVMALNDRSLSISADGRRVAVAGRGSSGSAIWVRDLREADFRALVGSELGHSPRISPDGEWVVFDRGHSPVPRGRGSHLGGNTFRMPFGGGPIDGPFNLTGESWMGANELLGRRGNQVLRIDAAGREQVFLDCEACSIPDIAFPMEWLEPVAEDAVLFSPPGGVLSPEEQEGESLGGSEPRIYFWKKGEEPVPILERAQQPMRVGDRLLFVRRGEVWAARLSSEGLPQGHGVPTGLRAFSSALHKELHLDVARDSGSLVFLDAYSDFDLWETDERGFLRRKFELKGPLAVPLDNAFLKVSPDGHHALVSGRTQLRVASLEDGQVSRPVAAHHSGWLGNRQFGAASYAATSIGLFELDGTQSGEVPLQGSVVYGEAHPRTQAHLFHRFAQREGQIVPPYTSIVVKVSGGDTETVWFNSDGFDRFPTFSPDGNWVAFESDTNGRMEVNVSPWQEEAQPTPVSTDGGQLPRWSKDGSTLYFVDSDNSHLMAVDWTPGQGRGFSPPRQLFALPEGTIVTQRAAYDSLPGGGFLFAIARSPPKHRLVLDWMTAVDRMLAGSQKRDGVDK